MKNRKNITNFLSVELAQKDSLHEMAKPVFGGWGVGGYLKCLLKFLPSRQTNIKETCLYNFDPLKPHFYIVKLGFTGVYIIFLISAQKT